MSMGTLDKRRFKNEEATKDERKLEAQRGNYTAVSAYSMPVPTACEKVEIHRQNSQMRTNTRPPLSTVPKPGSLLCQRPVR
ncbi:hypothetical protein SS1G_04091 [Sclerotinia sclerotiorum 1980 UF-70]|uniref:Uncharacterized protein n=1 Tax=Sclerotinia sclerotiorum (strain ATCC 18683 / 1980 / Ss-1) TaxID=665079 RepID=A7EFK0_SCLS1|nr:hypothetical protein SS1G_04091 [Sclerotinia sclerotiorum 1980 UF-70]EDO01616.1 hypothetical protein SS1G_04091 [Sclerotinia sclerotiorum 1980 UF-70]